MDADTLRHEASHVWWRFLDALPGIVDAHDLDNWDPRVIRAFHVILAPLLDHYFRATVSGADNIPDGRVLMVGVHGGGVVSPDLLLTGTAFYEHFDFSRPLYGLAHRMFFHIPYWAKFLGAIGGVAGNRENARRILAAEQALIVFPGGEYDVARTWSHRFDVNFHARSGFVRVALDMNAPVVPVATIGGQATWIVLSAGEPLAKALRLKSWLQVNRLPMTFSLPWGFSIGYPPFWPLPAKLAVAFGEPLRFKPSAKEKQDPEYVALVRDEIESSVSRLTHRLRRGAVHLETPPPEFGI